MNEDFTVGRATLDNGLRIVHTYDPGTAMVALNVLYDVGTRDESRELTGMAHLFEHLMFGGSVNIPSYDDEIERAGGTDNAWTSSDFTNFYLSIPAQNVETAFRLESDRMLALAFSERSLEVQRSVVIEEFKQQCLDRPYGRLFHHLRAAVYAPEHPYSWPVIGLVPEHIAKVTMEDVRHWFYNHYAPNNAVLSVSGNITFERTVALAEKWFGDIPRRDISARKLPSPGFPNDIIELDISDTVPVPLLVIAVPMDSYGTEGYFAADAITDLLGAGRSARLVRNVVHGVGRGLISDADASIVGSEHEGMLLLTARLTDPNNAAADRARELLLDEARRLTEPVNNDELQRCFNNFESTFRFSNTGYAARASNLAMAEYHGEDINRTVSNRRSLSPEIIAQHATRLFNDTPYVSLLMRNK